MVHNTDILEGACKEKEGKTQHQIQKDALAVGTTFATDCTQAAAI